MKPMTEEELETLLQTTMQGMVTLRQATEDQTGKVHLKAQQVYCALASMMRRYEFLKHLTKIANDMEAAGCIPNDDGAFPDGEHRDFCRRQFKPN